MKAKEPKSVVIICLCSQVSAGELLPRWACALHRDHLPCSNPVVGSHPGQCGLSWKSHLQFCRYCLTVSSLHLSLVILVSETSSIIVGSLLASSAVILAISCIVFVARIALVTWKHYKQPLYRDSEPNMSPAEIALTQSNVFLRILG